MDDVVADRCEQCGVRLSDRHSRSHAQSAHHEAFVMIDRRTRAGWVPALSKAARPRGAGLEFDGWLTTRVRYPQRRREIAWLRVEAFDLAALEWSARVDDPTTPNVARRALGAAIAHARELLEAARLVRGGTPWWLAWRVAVTPADPAVPVNRTVMVSSMKARPTARSVGHPFWTRLVRT
jgi:hypothetical protein